MAEPGSMAATATSSASVGCRPGAQRWLPGTNLVAPFSCVKGSSGHIVLTTTVGCGLGSG